jgi:hypothetical protein
MLKIIYTETGVHLELLVVDRDDWIAARVQFAASIGEQMIVRKERATFLLPNPICDVSVVEAYLRQAGARGITVQRSDRQYVELGIAGRWMSADPESAEGIFVTQQLDRVEFCLWQLWHATEDLLLAGDEIIS